MLQTKVSLNTDQIEFLNNHQIFGYRDKSEMVRDAIYQLQKQIQHRRLQESAILYAELYESDSELQELTELATAEWPE